MLPGSVVKPIALLFGTYVAAAGICLPVFAAEAPLTASLAKVRAYQTTGAVSLGSAVRIAPDTLVTNCHVLDAAQRIVIVRDETSVLAQLDAADFHHDLCILRTADNTGPAAMPTDTVAVGDAVVAAGFPAGNDMVITRGRVVALHNYEGARVIQISAPFDAGESGGALFDTKGRLIGILAFKAKVGGPFYFALPVSWLAAGAAAHHLAAGTHVPFWRQSYSKLPQFLRAIAIQITQAADRLPP